MCNVDGAWDKSKDNCGIGWVLRDHHGAVCWIGSRRLPKMRTPLEVEAEAVRWAMRFMLRLNFGNVIFETDSKCLVEAFKEEDRWPSLSTYLQDIKSLKSKMEGKKLAFQYREANRVADRIAKEIISFENNAPRLYTIMPNWVKTYVENDIVSG